MEGFGAYLRREREFRGIALREVSQATKISLHSLEALESEQFDSIGGEVFVRGFLRNYARYLGLDPDDLVMRYDELRLRETKLLEAETQTEETSLSRGPNQVMLVAALAVVVGIIVFLVVVVGDDEGRVAPPVRAAHPAVSARVEPAPLLEDAAAPVTEATDFGIVEAEAAAPETAAVEASPAAVQPTVRLVIRADEPCYLKVWVDDGEPLERQLPVGGELRFEALEKIELLAGNAGGVVLDLNGKTLPRLGPSGKVRRRLVTAAGVFVP